MLNGPVGGSPIQGGAITGADVAFTIGDASYAVRLDGNKLVGTRTQAGRSEPWQATRILK